MSSNHTPSEPLIERISGFNYSYRMRCECGRSSTVSAVDYWDHQDTGLIPCEHCGKDIHYGRLATVLRDPNDPAMSNDAVARFAWYHTSSFPEWPPTNYPELMRAALESLDTRCGIQIESALQRATTKALHVGTYEASIENMHRRMQNQNDADKVFYLHRVRLAVAAKDISSDTRDETQDAVSQIALDELRHADLLAVRYLNVYESPGSLSLAIDPVAIESVQTIELPVADLAEKPPSGLVDALRQFTDELSAADALMPDLSDVDREQSRLRFLFPRAGDELAIRVKASEMRSRQAWTGIERLLADTYLRNVNPVVLNNFTAAVTPRSHEDPCEAVNEFHDRFRGHAAALTRAEELVTLLKKRPVRHLSGK
ncbi:MAG: hypothetical protein WAW17_26965 [Rhodococcus sp. (in: high G+C Gram-positive bacteria)]|uniref:hypothetical protein n=1 Tax=Rhodococcus sp. TaxID=1831 RepID=UPI003BB0354A